MSFSSEPYVQIKLSGTSFCLGVLDRKNANSKSKLIIYQCDSKMKGQAFQMKEVGGGYNILYNTYKGGNEDVDRTLCVNNPSSGGTLQLYQCKSGDPNSLWYYKNGKLVSKKDDQCMATEVPAGQSSLSNSDYVDAMWCGEEYTKWNVPTPRPTPRPPTPRPSSGACNHYCKGDNDCVWLGGSNPCKYCYKNECVKNKPPPTPAPRPSSGGRCNDYCYKDSDCKTSCSKCVDYGDGVRKWCQKPPQKGQCDRQCSANWDCSNDGGKWTTGQPWCGQCKNGWCSPNKQSCNYDYDCPRDKAVCGPNGYCVGK